MARTKNPKRSLSAKELKEIEMFYAEGNVKNAPTKSLMPSANLRKSNLDKSLLDQKYPLYKE